ncbi:MAG: hypothetical protein ACTHZ9_13030 [Leucobacter sp.]
MLAVDAVLREAWGIAYEFDQRRVRVLVAVRVEVVDATALLEVLAQQLVRLPHLPVLGHRIEVVPEVRLREGVC